MGNRLLEAVAHVCCQGAGALDYQGYSLRREEAVVGKEFIRQATPQDIDALLDIYIECFRKRVDAVFGRPQRRVFIGDYLLFY